MDEEGRQCSDQHERYPGIAEGSVKLGALFARQTGPKRERAEHQCTEGRKEVNDDLWGEAGKCLHAATVRMRGAIYQRFAMECRNQRVKCKGRTRKARKLRERREKDGSDFV